MARQRRKSRYEVINDLASKLEVRLNGALRAKTESRERRPDLDATIEDVTVQLGLIAQIREYEKIMVEFVSIFDPDPDVFHKKVSRLLTRYKVPLQK